MKDRVKVGTKVSINTIIANIILGLVKVIAGIIASSNAMIADGVHSFSDVITTFGVIVGLKLSNKPDDKCHPYGHEKIESISALFLAMILFAVAIGIGFGGIVSIINGDVKKPGVLAILAAIISIIVKEWMYFYTIKYAKKLNSSSLRADAWHHRSDSLSSLGALVGIITARMGFPIFDSAVAVIISIIIMKVAYDVIQESIGQLIDSSAKEENVREFYSRLKGIDGIRRIDSLKTRQHANKIYVDVEVSVDSILTVEEGHHIAVLIHNSIEENPLVKHCMVHINPFNK